MQSDTRTQVAKKKFGSLGSVWKVFQVVFVVVIFFIILVFVVTRQRVDGFTKKLNEEISAMFNDDIDLTVPINETIPVVIDVPLDDLIDMKEIIPSSIPYETTVPIKTTVHINQTVSVPVEIPMAGTVSVQVPIVADVPVNESVPVSTTVDVDHDSFDTSDQMVHIEEDVEIDMPIVLNVNVADLGIEPRVEGLGSLINTLRFVFLLGPIELEL